MKFTRIKKGQLGVGKWHFKLGLISRPYAPNMFLLHFGIFKITSRPPEGGIITKTNYKGFWLKKDIKINDFEISI